jgi:hypothetical protein
MFPILYAGAKFWRRTPTVRPSEMDFYSGLAEIEAETYDEPPPRNKMEAFWQWLVSDEMEAFCMRLLIASIDVRERYLSCIVALNCLIPEPCHTLAKKNAMFTVLHSTHAFTMAVVFSALPPTLGQQKHQ